LCANQKHIKRSKDLRIFTIIQAIGASMFKTIISSEQLKTLTNPLIIDVRHDLSNPDAGRAAYMSGHISGAYFLHLDHDLSGNKTGTNGRHPLPDLDTLAQTLRKFGLNNDMQVVVYDADNSMMAARAWWLLRHLGHASVAVLDGGFAAWQRSGGNISDTITAPNHAGQFTQKPSLNKTVAVDEVAQHLNDNTQRIIDARAPNRFSGAVEPIDPVGGHIPHALNCFFMHNLNADLTFKSAAELKQQWHAVFEHPNVINQCGSGVTACHNILAQHMAGFENGALYVGSWSEWCADVNRPVAKGEL
jgi:thiosulfate/3-mercaptopyruvate sulfurtransferase